MFSSAVSFIHYFDTVKGFPQSENELDWWKCGNIIRREIISKCVEISDRCFAWWPLRSQIINSTLIINLKYFNFPESQFCHSGIFLPNFPESSISNFWSIIGHFSIKKSTIFYGVSMGKLFSKFRSAIFEQFLSIYHWKVKMVAFNFVNNFVE